MVVSAAAWAKVKLQLCDSVVRQPGLSSHLQTSLRQRCMLLSSRMGGGHLLPATASAELLSSSQSNSEFYATLPRHSQQKSLLCCVCHEHNTTFRYEVVYKSTSAADKKRPQDVVSKSPPTSITDLVHQQVTLTTSVEDTESSDDHEYYNFPPRHPRHGHLKWPLIVQQTASLKSEAALNFNHSAALGYESLCISTYPDYPVHLSTFTLKRVASAIKQKGRRGILDSLRITFLKLKKLD